MATIAEIKKFLLKYLREAGGLPIPQPQLETVCLGGFVPRPLLSDVHEAMRGLETDGFIQGENDDLDPQLVTWTLTAKGQHRAKQL